MNHLVNVEVTGRCCVLTLNAPRRHNALSTALRLELLARLDELYNDRSIGAIVLRGAGGNFCSGGDVTEMAPPDGANDPVRVRQRLEILHAVVKRITAGTKPVIAAIEGFAYGGGLSLALACDYLIADDTARFSAVFGRIGLMADCGLLWTMPQRIGLSATRDLLFSARSLNTEEALRIGLIDQSVPAGEALAAALKKASEYGEVAPLAIAATKAALARAPATLDEALHVEADLQIALCLSADHREAREAFLNKRKPVFTGS